MLLSYILKRVSLMFLTFFAIISFTFFFISLTPGNPYNNEKLTVQQVEKLDEEYGFSLPLYKQYFNYLQRAIGGDLGRSFQNNQDIATMISTKLPVSLQLGLMALILGSTIGILLGSIAALKKNSFWDYLATTIAVIGVSFPFFVIASINQYLFGVKFPILPTSYLFGTGFNRWILPVFSLSLFSIASVARMSRTEMLEVLNANYITLAKSKGLSDNKVILKHAFRNTLIPIITILGPMGISLMTGSLVIENIFSIPGLGAILIDAIFAKDIFVVMACVSLYSFMFLSIYLIVDILYALCAPLKIRTIKSRPK